MLLNIIMNSVMGASLALLWSLINSLQIIAHLSLLVVSFPPQAQAVYEMIYTLSTFDLISLDYLQVQS